ncbi:MAG TPA: glycosyltransferase family 39 protein, partial [Pirellulales bacterium]|nr:glycosyltransferase family 39 protein [Pirellulales bacterium]
MGRIDKDRWFDGLWLTACLAASSVWCISAGRQLSATFDEPLYLERGLEVWRTGSHAGLMKLGTMPLAIDGCTLPLYLYERWSATPIDPVRDLNRILPWSRSAALVFWWLLLVYGWLAGRSLAGPWGGRLAVAWLACEPNLLAHAALATTDIAVSACLLALVYHFRAGRERSWWPRVGLPGLWFGAALLAKASGMVFGPLCLIAVEAHRMWNTRPWP